MFGGSHTLSLLIAVLSRPRYFPDPQRRLCTAPCPIHIVSAHGMLLFHTAVLFAIIPIFSRSAHLSPRFSLAVALFLSICFFLHSTSCLVFFVHVSICRRTISFPCGVSSRSLAAEYCVSPVFIPFLSTGNNRFTVDYKHFVFYVFIASKMCRAGLKTKYTFAAFIVAKVG